MATTSIWRVGGWLGKVVIYVENPDKTENPAAYEKPDMEGRDAQGLSDVIEYAVQQQKTEKVAADDEGTAIMQRFVSGVNCSPSTARDEMIAVKKRFGKEDGTVAYHGYQSFAPGEADPQTAHEIGLKLAKKLWGEKYQVVVATHLDKSNHLHNNFDDLFEQQPQKEAALQKPEGQKERPKRQWWQIREEKQRKEAYASLDKIFGAFAEGNGNMEAYLDVQSRFPFHSARNALLIGAQCPQAQRVGGYKEWTAQGIEILEEEKRLPIIILEPGKAYRRDDGSIGQNFYAKEVYDISQTSAQGQHQPQVTYDDRLLLKGLIASSPVQIRAVDELPQGRGAVFSEEQNAILVKKGMDAPDIFRCVSLEIANVQLARSNEGYSREADGYKAYAVSYMLCKRYGIEAKGYDIARLNSVFKGQDPREDVPAALSDMRETFKSLNGRMARAMGLTRDTKQKEPER